MTKEVFIVADIGLNKSEGYHVGDEAMFLANLERYLKLGGWVVNASSRSISHSNLDFNEFLDIYITSQDMYCDLKNKVNELIANGSNNFPDFFKPTIEAVKRSSLVHISGGGNLTTLWKGHIYYRCFIIYLAKQFGKKVILTGQTIGHLDDTFCKQILLEELNKVDLIGLRDKKDSAYILNNIGVSKNICIMIDDAYLWKIPDNKNSPKVEIKVGLSIHKWNHKFNQMLKLVDALNSLSKIYKLKVYLIPHYTSIDGNNDCVYMNNLLLKSKTLTNIFAYTHQNLTEIDGANTAEKIFSLTSKMDIMLTTRYHGLVFGFASLVPTLAINIDEYCSQKNWGFLELFNATEIILNDHTISLKAAPLELELKIKYLIDNNQKIKTKLKMERADILTNLETLTLEKILHTLNLI